MNNSVTIPIESNLGNAPLQLGDFFSNIVGMALIVAAAITFGLLVWGGIQWIFSGGDKGKLEEAKNRITNAIIGLAIVAASWAIFLLLDHFLGLNVANGSRSTSNPKPTPNSTTLPSTNNPCVCGNGKCAALNEIGALDYAGTACYKCTKTGWQKTNTTECPPITCTPCQ